MRYVRIYGTVQQSYNVCCVPDGLFFYWNLANLDRHFMLYMHIMLNENTILNSVV